MGNRWWAIAFVGFVCWQAVDYIGTGKEEGNEAATAAPDDMNAAAAASADLHNALESLNSSK